MLFFNEYALENYFNVNVNIFLEAHDILVYTYKPIVIIF